MDVDVPAFLHMPSTPAQAMGSGPLWLTTQRIPFCQYIMANGMDSIRGTDQGNKHYFESVLELWWRDLRDAPNIR